MRIHVGNLSPSITDDQISQEFQAFGAVASATVIRDKRNGQSKGFAFVEMPARSEGQAAIEGLKGRMIGDRTLDVSEATSRPGGKKGSGAFGGGGRSGFRGRGKRKR